MNKLQYHTLLVGGFALSLVTYPGQDVDGFVARQFTDASGAVMPYRVYVPGTPPARREYPLVVYLHGSGGAGTDNLRQISGGNVSGTHAWTTLEVQRREAVFVAAPQIPEGERWDDDSPVRAGRNATLVLELIDKLQKDYPIDRHRIYITGQSLGGFGAWGIAAKRPDVFAALIPLCGGGKPASAARLRGVPVWAFHGALDETVPVENSRGMVAALRKAGGTVKYTEYPDLGHAIWQRAYGDSALMAWTLCATPQKLGTQRKMLAMNAQANVRQAVPFFRVSNIEASVRYYVDGLGFEIKHKWIDEGVLRWCWLQCGDAALMLQEYRTEGDNSWTPDGKVGVGVSVCFICDDALALYRDFASRGIQASRPFVGNAMWVTTLLDPDGYRIEFESATDVPEETVLADDADDNP